jgi:GT2 family glycosyltransferase
MRRRAYRVAAMSIDRNGLPGRPSVSVVMPFAGSRDEAWAAVEALGRLHVLDGDELLLADNAGVLGSPGPPGLELRASTGVSVAIVRAPRERSPAHARNAGAAAAGDHTEWILFLDADTVAPADLLDRYFAEPIADDVGAVAGGIAAAPPGPSTGIVARYGVHKNFLDAGAHFAHPFMPRAAAANLLVRRAAFASVGGFFEGLRAAEDTDFSWRLQRAEWTLVGRPSAAVEHQYRDSLRALRRQWRGYAAGRAWLGRRYDGFAPQPALLRVGGTARMRGPASQPPRVTPSRSDRTRFAALDVVLAVEELFGFALSNRPPGDRSGAPGARRVLVADRFPDREPDASAAGDPADVGQVRIEAGARAERAAPTPAGATIVYREDDGPLDRARASATLSARRHGHVFMAPGRDHDAPSPAALAPAACRLLDEPEASLSPLSTDPRVLAAARRLAWLAGRESLRRQGWREMLTRRAKASKRIAAADDHLPNAPG